MNRDAMRQMSAPVELEIVPCATHLFEEPGTLEQVMELAALGFTGISRRIVPAIDIPRVRWPEFLDAFRRQHRAWLTTIEPSARGVEPRPLRAVETVREGGVLSAIQISFAG